jgi:hypothetical protein
MWINPWFASGNELTGEYKALICKTFKAAQESIPRNQFRQAGNRFLGSLIKRFTNSGSV